MAALNDANCTIYGANAGFYIWASHPDHATSESLANWFLKRNILVTPGTVFGANANPFIRMVYCISDDEIDQCCNHLSNASLVD